MNNVVCPPPSISGDPRRPIALDRVDIKRGYCFVFLRDVTSMAEKERIENYVSDINGMYVFGRTLLVLFVGVRSVCHVLDLCCLLWTHEGSRKACSFLPQRLDLFICNSACRWNLFFWFEIFRVIHPLSSNTGPSTR